MLNLKNIQAYIRTFGFIIPIILYLLLNSTIKDWNIIFYFFFFILIYSSIILYILFFIFKSKNKSKLQFETVSILKDKEYIIFKNNLLNLYYTTSIILFYFLFFFYFYF